MRRFQWPLQRLLDVTAQREAAHRAEMLRLSRDIARARQEIVARRRVIRAGLRELAAHALPERIGRQEIVMACSARPERDIRRLQQQLRDLHAQRQRRSEQFIRTRNTRQTLEKMREKARLAHLREALKHEQAELDERAHVAFARRARPAGHARETTGD